MLQGYVAKKWGDKMFEDDIAKIVKRRAFFGALVMALPLFGLEWIVFTIILWNMYSALCEKAGTKLKFGTIATGFIVNIVIAIAVDFLFTLLPVLGWLGTGFIVYLQFYLSGKAYIETLRKAYPNQANSNHRTQISQRSYSDDYLTTSVDNETTDKVYNGSQRPVMLYFYATWCIICKAAIVEDIEREYSGRINVKKVDVDTNYDLVAKYNIKNVPTFLFFMPGCKQYKDIVVGNTTNEILKQKLNDLL